MCNSPNAVPPAFFQGLGIQSSHQINISIQITKTNHVIKFILYNNICIHIAGKGLKALNYLIHNIKNYPYNPKITCQLFDSFISPVLSYACEIWGFSKSKELERIHLKFLKYILNVKTSTFTTAVYGELGRYPLYI